MQFITFRVYFYVVGANFIRKQFRFYIYFKTFDKINVGKIKFMGCNNIKINFEIVKLYVEILKIIANEENVIVKNYNIHNMF